MKTLITLLLILLGIQYKLPFNFILSTLDLQVLVPLTTAVVAVVIHVIKSLFLGDKINKFYIFMLFITLLSISIFMYIYINPYLYYLYNNYFDPIILGSSLAKMFFDLYKDRLLMPMSGAIVMPWGSTTDLIKQLRFYSVPSGSIPAMDVKLEPVEVKLEPVDAAPDLLADLPTNLNGQVITLGQRLGVRRVILDNMVTANDRGQLSVQTGKIIFPDSKSKPWDFFMALVLEKHYNLGSRKGKPLVSGYMFSQSGHNYFEGKFDGASVSPQSNAGAYILKGDINDWKK